MQEKTLDQLAVSYRETNDEKAFIEIQKRLRPLISKRSGRVRHLLSPDEIQQTAALAIAVALLRYDPAKGGFGAFATAFIFGELNRRSGLIRRRAEARDGHGSGAPAQQPRASVRAV